MRRVSLNARTARDAATTEAVEVLLLHIEHPALSAPLRLSSDPTERLSTDPLVYGTRSTWMSGEGGPTPHLFVVASAEVPGDLEDAPAAATIVVDAGNAETGQLLRSFIDRPVVHMAVVLATSPDLVEVEYRGLRIVEVEGNAAEVSLSISRAPIEDESVPMDRFTKDRFPGLFP
ncbi:hypothetical protein [Oceaniglobus trochenteri]|uniref:hypothetical protein n=1 Tax=Oceaniglobus trochenteri TaxID=2763260 RepID=UPI001CFFB3CF|nr:hypothetical protein [Oceaniglobus trochenteri]